MIWQTESTHGRKSRKHPWKVENTHGSTIVINHGFIPKSFI